MATSARVGELVWAKMKGFPAWPGKIIQPKSEVKRPSSKKLHYFVFFFGSENYAWIPEDNVYTYATNKSKFTLGNRLPRGFKEAVEAVEDSLKDMPEEDLKGEDLPSIDEELAQIFPNSTPSTPHKDYTREPLTGKRSASGKVAPVNKKRDNLKSIGRRLIKKPLDSKTTKPQLKRPAESKVSKAKAAQLKKNTVLSNIRQQSMKRASAAAVSPQKPKRQRLIAALSPSPIKSPDTTATRQKSTMEYNAYHLNTAAVSSSTQIEEEMLTLKAASRTIIPTPLKIGFLGLGIIGQGIVMNLLRSGHEVTVWNRTASKCRDFVKEGALKGNTPADVIRSCDITFSCVSDCSAVKDVVFGNSGVLQGIRPGKGYVEMSTIDVDTIEDVNEAITARGGSFLEAPVGGSRVPSIEGKLIVLASGDRKLYDDCYSCFEALAKKSLYLGEIGNGTTMKLVLNMVLGSVMAGLAEGMALAEKVGLDQEDVSEVLGLSSLSCPTINHKSQAILHAKYDPHFPLLHQQKDLRLALALGDKVEQPLYVAAAANELFKRARRLGYGESDISAVYRAASA